MELSVKKMDVICNVAIIYEKEYVNKHAHVQ